MTLSEAKNILELKKKLDALRKEAREIQDKIDPGGSWYWAIIHDAETIVNAFEIEKQGGE